jgi:hypothetical protein
VSNLRHRVNVNTLTHEPSPGLEMNGIGLVDVETSHPLFFDAYTESRSTGSFILIDLTSNATVAAGMILGDRSEFREIEQRRDSQNASPARPVTSVEKFERHGHRPATILLASTAVEAAERALFVGGFETIALRASSLNRESFRSVFDLLYSAGFLILIDADGLDLEIRRMVEQEHSERSILDLSGSSDQVPGGKLISGILAYAQSLRLASATEKGE